ncbi:hypothetical protein ABT369_00190 [Dactylosporangium sp. NPDC000244]|uniref:hypothetical protein n=1 Tax=Dactylosporangium sp. NPDC000244 TaxID=3154365 RepID=UPI00332B66F5
MPADPRRAAMWAAGIAGCAVLVLFLLLTSDLVFGRTVGLAAPAGIGDWAANPALAATLAEGVLGDQEALGARPFSAAYLSADGRPLLVWGGTGRAVQRADDAALLRTLRERTLRFVPDSGGGTTADADPGPNRGRATCTDTRRDGFGYVVCAWTFGAAALGVLVVDGPDADPAATLRRVLDAVVVMR